MLKIKIYCFRPQILKFSRGTGYTKLENKYIKILMPLSALKPLSQTKGHDISQRYNLIPSQQNYQQPTGEKYKVEEEWRLNS